MDTGGGVSYEGAETPLRVAVRGSRLFVVGRTVDAVNNWNFVVRAYHIGHHASDEDDGGDDDRSDDNQSSTP